MSRLLNKGYTDTPIDGVTALELNRGLINYAADFRKSTNVGGEAVLVNITSPADRLEKFRFAVQENNNIYAKSGINPALQAPYLSGANLVVGLKETWSVTESTDAAFRYDIPMGGHLVLNVPLDAVVTADDVLSFVGRLVSGLFETGSETSNRLKALLRGSLIPSDL